MTEKSDPPLKRLYQQIAHNLQKQILSGRYKAGARLPAERLLAEEFEVSRPTIREAMISLELSGLVVVKVGSGVYVVDDPQKPKVEPEHDIGAFELMEARRSIESEACAIAARNITDAQLAQLKKHLESMTLENHMGEIGEKADEKFHLTIAKATQNSAFVSVVEYLWIIRKTSPMLITMLKRAREAGTQPFIPDHERIFKALESRNESEAKQAMYDHLTRVINNLLEVTELEAIEKAKSSANALRSRFQNDA